MAFDLTAVGGYGSGTLGDVTSPFGMVINTVGVANNVDAKTIKLGNVYTGTYGTFKAGDEILIAIEGELTFTGITTAPDVKTYLGKYCVCNVTAFDNEAKILTVDADVSQKLFGAYPITSGDETSYPAFSGKILVTTIPHYKNLTLGENCTLTPRTIPECGSILALKCSEALTFNGGHIDLRDKGLPTTEADNRPLMTYETRGTIDTDKYSGWENSDTKDRLILNVGDGAAFIITKKLVCHADSRVGNIETDGVQFCRGSSKSPNTPTGVTNIGGSTILICAGSITSFEPSMIAKYRNSSSAAGKGIARCYIASDTKLRNDEGLYAYDCISTPTKITTTLNIKSFGDGSANSVTNPAGQINNYATITALDDTRKVLTYTNMTTTGTESFLLGSLVMVHFNHKDSKNTVSAGKFILAKIIGMDAEQITLDTAAPYISNVTDYNCQILTIPQYTDFTLNMPYQSTPAYDGAQGGIFALACNGTCDLSDGVLNVENKGGGKAYAYNGLKQIGNAQDSDKLPIGQGHGSVFILAQNLVMNANTRIGGTQNGAAFGGGNKYNKHSVDGGGYYGGRLDENPTGFIIARGNAGWGGGGGKPSIEDFAQTDGGYGSNGDNVALVNSNNDVSVYRGGKQGAHIMIIADTITGFNQAAISTGGGRGGSKSESGGAGYGGGGNIDMGTTASNAYLAAGGGGGYNGGGGASASPSWHNVNSLATPGGSSGWAFIYCNNVVNQDTTDTVVDY